MALGAESQELPALTPQNETDPPRHGQSGKRLNLVCPLPPLGPCLGSLPLQSRQHRGVRSGAPLLSMADWLQRAAEGLQQPRPLGSFYRQAHPSLREGECVDTQRVLRDGDFLLPPFLLKTFPSLAVAMEKVAGLSEGQLCPLTMTPVLVPSTMFPFSCC